MIVIIGAVRVAVIGDLAGRVGERIPDRASAAVLVDGALDLVRGSGGAPKKALRESGRGGPVRGPFGRIFVPPRPPPPPRRCGKTPKLGKMPTRELTEHRLSPVRLPSGMRHSERLQ